MAFIQPTNTNGILIDEITEKSAAAGITLNSDTFVDNIEEATGGNGIDLNALLTVETTGLVPLISTADIGTNVSGESFRKLYIQSVLADGHTITAKTESAHDLILGAANIANLTIKGAVSTSTPANRLEIKLGHTAYTSGGEIELFTAAATSTSTSPTSLMFFTLPTTDMSMTFLIAMESRDTTAATSSFVLLSAQASRAGAGAVAGTVGTATATSGTALGTITLNASSNTIEVRVQNVSGTNTTYHKAMILAIPVKTST